MIDAPIRSRKVHINRLLIPDETGREFDHFISLPRHLFKRVPAAPEHPEEWQSFRIFPRANLHDPLWVAGRDNPIREHNPPVSSNGSLHELVLTVGETLFGCRRPHRKTRIVS